MKKFIIISLIPLFCICLTGCGQYRCDSGDELKGTTCISTKTTPAQREYYCNLSGYYLTGNRCVNKWGVEYDAKKRYYCTSGYLNDNNECVIETTYNAYR